MASIYYAIRVSPGTFNFLPLFFPPFIRGFGPVIVNSPGRSRREKFGLIGADLAKPMPRNVGISAASLAPLAITAERSRASV